jgi:hypothetical protein
LGEIDERLPERVAEFRIEFRRGSERRFILRLLLSASVRAASCGE